MSGSEHGSTLASSVVAGTLKAVHAFDLDGFDEPKDLEILRKVFLSSKTRRHSLARAFCPAAGGVEPLDFAAADEAVSQLVEVVGGEHDDRLGRELFEAVEPHHFGLRSHAVGCVDDDHFPAAAGHRAEVHAPDRSSTARPSCVPLGISTTPLQSGSQPNSLARPRAAAVLPTPIGGLRHGFFRLLQRPDARRLGIYPGPRASRIRCVRSWTRRSTNN